MKRISLLLLAFAMVFGMSQCKKNNEMITDNAVTDGVTISLKVAGDNDGSKVIVTPGETLATVEYEDGDRIIVASGGKYVGTLTRTNGIFTGTLHNVVPGEQLRFYFLGNKEGELTVGETECYVSIDDQTTGKLPVLSAGESYEYFDKNVTSYTAHLYNKCALVKFIITNHTTATVAPIYLGKGCKTVHVYFYGGFGTKDQYKTINIAVGATGTTVERWAIMLAQQESTDATTKTYGDITVSQEKIGTIKENDFKPAGISVVLNDAE